MGYVSGRWNNYGFEVAVLQGSHESGDKSIDDIKHLWAEKVWLYFASFVVCFQIFLGNSKCVILQLVLFVEEPLFTDMFEVT